MISEEDKKRARDFEHKIRVEGSIHRARLGAVKLYREREEFRVIVDNYPNQFADIVEYIHGRESRSLSEESEEGYSPMITDTTRKMMAAAKNKWWSGVTQSEVARNLIQLVLWIIALWFLGLVARQHG